MNPGPLQENSGKNTETPVKSQGKVEHKQRVKQDLTLITGSCIVRGIETRFLDENVRVKHFKNAKIDDLKFEQGKMDLSRYRNIVIHVGGHDIDAKCSLNIFREKYQSLLNQLTNQNCKVYVSGLLPRGRINVKPFNDILLNISNAQDLTFIDNHDSFILATGDLPFDFFYADKTNLKFAGTRALVRSINSYCSVLPKRKTSPSTYPVGNKAGYTRRNFANQNYRGSRHRPIWVY